MIGKGEVLLTIMASLAQEESRSISENVKWGHRKRFADGKEMVAFSHFLGYDRGDNGEFVVNQEQAKVIKFIYGEFLIGLSYGAIAKKLMELGIKAPGGQEKWHEVNDAYDHVQSDIAANARMARDQAEYRKGHDELVSKYEEACDRYQKAKEKLMQMEAKKRELDNFIKSVADLPEVVTDFDNSLWGAIVDHVTVYRHGEICFTLRDGSEVKA